jgi:phenylalanyl-tRNA synthetase beta chain
MTISAIAKAVEMAQNLAGGKMEGDIIDIYPNPVKPKEIEFNFSRIENLLGIRIEKRKAIEILNSLNFKVFQSGENLKVLIPTYRIDIEKVNDIIEEIGRIYGYENIPETAPMVEMKPTAGDKILSLEKDIRIISESLGFCEIYNYSFVSEKDINNIGLEIESHLELQNPLSEGHKFLRVSVLPYLLRNVERNLKFRDDFMLFELGKVYLKSDDKLPNEKRVFAGVIADRNIKNTLFYKLKGRVDVLLNRLGIGKLTYKEIESAEPFWHTGRSAEIVCQDKTVGKIGEVHPSVLNAFDIETRVLYFELYEERLVEFYGRGKLYKRISKFPSVELDLSVVFDESVKWDNIEKLIFSVGGKLVKSVEPFDIYRERKLGENKKSIAFRVVYQAEDRTLEDKEVMVIQNKIIRELVKLGGEIRR